MLLSDIGVPYNWTMAELHAFCLVCESRNLSQVALRLGMSQSAVSLMVQRWRDALDDPLFVRGRYGVTPTEIAIALRKRIEPLLNDLKTALAQPHGFDPGRTERVFRLHMSDIGQLVFLPKLNTLLGRQAPGVRLWVRNLPWEDVEAALASGDLDAAIGSLPMIKGRVHARTLRKERYVTVMRRQHPLAKGRLNLAAFAAAEHLVIEATGSGHALVEEVLRAKGVHRKIGLTLPHYLAAERVLATSNYLLTVPEVATSALHHPQALHIAPAPLALPTFDIRIHWHERSRRDESVLWLRNVVVELFAQA